MPSSRARNSKAALACEYGTIVAAPAGNGGSDVDRDGGGRSQAHGAPPIALRDAVERRAGDADGAAWRTAAQLNQTKLMAAQAAQGSVGDVVAARADADRLNLELARTLAASTTRSGVLRAR